MTVIGKFISLDVCFLTKQASNLILGFDFSAMGGKKSWLFGREVWVRG